jgi:hypothetical protein
LWKSSLNVTCAVSLNFSKEFLIFSFASNDTIAGVLLQKNEQGNEQPIDFMSKTLRDVELNYTSMEKQSYALVKSLKHFRTYVGYSRIVAFVPHPAVKDILSQHDCLGTRGKWVSKIQEYDLEIKPTKIIKGQGLAKLMTKGNEEALGLKDEHCNMVSAVTQVLEQHDWYKRHDLLFETSY